MTQQTDITKFPLLVNKSFYLPHHYVPKNLISFPNTSFMATSSTVNAFLQMQQDAAKFNHSLALTSAYRSFKDQTTLYEEFLKIDPQNVVDTYCARPGHSEHQTGYALDVCVTHHELDLFDGTPECLWLHAHAHRYGFIIRYPQNTTEITGYLYEPWHITYVGTDIATHMKLNEIKTLEEYIFKYTN